MFLLFTHKVIVSTLNNYLFLLLNHLLFLYTDYVYFSLNRLIHHLTLSFILSFLAANYVYLFLECLLNIYSNTFFILYAKYVSLSAFFLKIIYLHKCQALWWCRLARLCPITGVKHLLDIFWFEPALSNLYKRSSYYPDHIIKESITGYCYMYFLILFIYIK